MYTSKFESGLKLDLYKEARKCLQTPLPLAIGQPNVENHNTVHRPLITSTGI